MSKRIIKSALFIGLLLVIVFLAYYHFLYKVKHVEGGIFKLNRVLALHTSDVWTVKFDSSGHILASGSVDSTIKLWNRNNGALISSIKQPAGVTSLDFSPEGNYLVSGSYDEKVRIWKMPEGTLWKELPGHRGTVWTVNFSRDGKTIASSGEDATIKLWDVESGQLKKTLIGHSLNVWDIKFSPDKTTLASGSFDKTIKVWNVNDGRLLHTIDAHTQAIVSLAFTHDGQILVSTSDDKTIRLWSTQTWDLIYAFNVPEHAQAAVFSPDDKFLVTGGRDKPAIGELLQNFFGDSKYNPGVSMRLWDVQTGNLLQTFSLHSNDVNDVDFSKDGKWIASGSSDKTVELWRSINN